MARLRGTTWAVPSCRPYTAVVAMSLLLCCVPLSASLPSQPPISSLAHAYDHSNIHNTDDDMTHLPNKRLALSISGDLNSLASMMRQLHADYAHSALIDIGKKSGAPSEEFQALFHHFNKPVYPSTRQTKRHRMSVDMPLTSITDMLLEHRRMNKQRKLHSELLKIGKRSPDGSTNSRY